MSYRKTRYSITSSEEEEKINYLMPDIVLAVEALQLATADRIHQCLQECDIKASPSQIMMALEYGCKLGLMEERTRYRLNPELMNQNNCFDDNAPREAAEIPDCCIPKDKKVKNERQKDEREDGRCV